MEHKDITEKIIGCAYSVYNNMGFGFLESVYEKCLLIELKKLGLDSEVQKQIVVYYEGIEVGTFVADVLVEGCIVVELKSVTTLSKAHHAQLVNYLKAGGMPVGLLINFGERGVEVKRKVPDLKMLKDKEQNPANPVNPVKRKGQD